MFHPALLRHHNFHSSPWNELLPLIFFTQKQDTKCMILKSKIVEHDHYYTLEIRSSHLLGRTQDELELNAQPQHLTLRIQELNLTNNDKLDAIWEEIPSKQSEYSFKLPDRIDLQNVTAELRDDRLAITLPKVPKTSQKISIKSA